MNALPAITRGTKAEFTLMAKDSAVDAVSFSASDTIAAVVLPGGRRASVFSPSCSWVSATSGTITVSISATQSAAIGAGIYRLVVTVATAADSGNPLEVWSGYIEFIDAAGSVAEPTKWATIEDMQAYYPSITNFQSPKDQTNFGYQLAKATEDLRYWIYNRYDPQPGFQKRRSSTYDDVYGFDVIDTTTTPFGKEELLAALRSDDIELDSQAVEIVARLANASVLKRQISAVSNTTSTLAKASENPFAKAANDQVDAAKEVFSKWKARIKHDGGSSVTLLVDRDCVYLSGYTT